MAYTSSAIPSMMSPESSLSITYAQASWMSKCCVNIPHPSTFLQYYYIRSHFVYRFWVLKTGPACLMGQQCVALKMNTHPFIFWEDWLLRSSEKWECCAMSSLMWPWPERMVSGLKPTKISWLAVVLALTFSWMVLFQMSRKQKRKRQTGRVSGCPKF